MPRKADTPSSTSATAGEFVCVWRHRVADGRVGPFLEAYSPGGRWVALFRRSPDFLGTELVQHQGDPFVFATIDRWKSAQAYKAFRTAFAAEYLALDTICSDFTDGEELIAEGALR